MSLFSKKESNTLGSLLLPGERVITYAKQRRLHGAMFYPTVAIATNKRIIIVNRTMLRVWSDISFINYDQVISLRVMHGPLFSTIKMRLKGTAEKSVGGGDGEIHGLTHFGAVMVSNAINRALNNGGDISGDVEVVTEEGYNNYAQERLYTELGWNPAQSMLPEDERAAYAHVSVNVGPQEHVHEDEVNVSNANGAQQLIKQVARHFEIGYKVPEIGRLAAPKNSVEVLATGSGDGGIAGNPGRTVADSTDYSMNGSSASSGRIPAKVMPQNMLIFKERQQRRLRGAEDRSGADYENDGQAAADV